MKRALIVATVLKKHIVQFHIPTIKMLKDMGWQVDVAAANDYDGDYDVSFCDNFYDIPFGRSPLSKTNHTAYKQLKQLIDNGQYDVVHCHTPMGGFLTRFAAREARKKGTKVFYTAHGFHFYKGAPLINWILYYPAEKIASRYTDIIITINQEDYQFAQKNLDAKQIEYIPGVGVDIDRFADAVPSLERTYKKRLLSVGELIPRKNHKSVIEALNQLNDNSIGYLIAGDGELKEELSDKATLLGYRTDLPGIYKSADLFILPSIQEGLPVALIEAMAAGVPCIASDIRGCRELLDSEDLFNPKDTDKIAALIKEHLYSDERDTNKTYKEKLEFLSRKNVIKQIERLYEC